MLHHQVDKALEHAVELFGAGLRGVGALQGVWANQCIERLCINLMHFQQKLQLHRLLLRADIGQGKAGLCPVLANKGLEPCIQRFCQMCDIAQFAALGQHLPAFGIIFCGSSKTNAHRQN